MTGTPTFSRTAQRSLLATVEITGAASLAHVLAGGRLPGAGFLFAFALLVFGCCLATLGRRLHVGLVVPLVLLAQVGLHAALDAAPMMHGAMAATPMSASAPLGLTPVMIWAHLVTALVTAIVLLGQERLVARLVDWFCPLVVALVVPAAPGARRASAVGVRGARAELLRVSPRRGPPVAVTLAR